MNTFFNIITPTFNRSHAIIERCIASVDAQIHKNWKHFVIIDDVDKNKNKHVPQNLIEKYSSPKREFICLGHNSNNFGNSPRKLGINLSTENGYIVFVDDDNIIFPNYLSTFNKNIQPHPNIITHICKIIHMGPLPPNLGTPPKILNGNPPVLQNIDTLQVCVKSQIMKQHGWLNMGYMADGYTIQSLCKNWNYTYIDNILGVHM